MKSWMNDAVKHPGALTRKAKAAGEGVQEFAREHKHSAGATGKQARLDLVFAKTKHKGKKKSHSNSLYGEGGT